MLKERLEKTFQLKEKQQVTPTYKAKVRKGLRHTIVTTKSSKAQPTEKAALQTRTTFTAETLQEFIDDQRNYRTPLFF